MRVTYVVLGVACLLLASTPAAAQDQDVAILNFALNLEYLEANFYSCAAFGEPLSGARIGGGPQAVGCTGQAKLSDKLLALATNIANDEIKHVDYLRTSLGTAAVPQPLIDIGGSFDVAASAAFGPQRQAFTGYSNDETFLLAAYIFADVGVTAYKGAAPLLTNKAYIAPAAGILGVEGYHAGAIRSALLEKADKNVFPYRFTVSQAAASISALRDRVDGINATTDYGILNGDGSYNLAPTDKHAIAFSRSPKRVLPIVYLGGVGKGGFFPNGMNGRFNSSASSP